METLNSLALPQFVVPQASPLLPHSFPASQVEQDLTDDLEAMLRRCAPGYVWNDETRGCELQISLRTPNCPWGYTKNHRLNECRRVKYNYEEQQKGSLRKWWDNQVNPPKPQTTTVVVTTQRTTRYTGAWFGYGSNFGRNDPHW